MPDEKAEKRAEQDREEGKSPSTQAGEFVKEEMDHIREGKHGARSSKQAIAVGLSRARRAGVKLPPPAKGRASEGTRKKAELDVKKGASKTKRATSSKRSKATSKALKREGHKAASKKSLSAQAKKAASRRTSSERSRSAKKAAATRKAHQRSR